MKKDIAPYAIIGVCALAHIGGIGWGMNNHDFEKALNAAEVFKSVSVQDYALERYGSAYSSYGWIPFSTYIMDEVYDAYQKPDILKDL